MQHFRLLDVHICAYESYFLIKYISPFLFHENISTDIRARFIRHPAIILQIIHSNHQRHYAHAGSRHLKKGPIIFMAAH